ncbi:MAG: beta/alpha barrel domain-containing protein [Planctomycetota bacterium]|jgi:dihydroorotate dehydrogenase
MTDRELLSVEVLPGLTLRDPFMIASSHWTASKQSLSSLAPFRPSALTLKTTSQRHGGDGKSYIGDRVRAKLRDSRQSEFASFTDGPKTLELLDVPSTLLLTNDAKALLPSTAVGLSVLQGEDYSAIASDLLRDDYKYVELNMKYTLRGVDLDRVSQSLGELGDDLRLFLSAFESRPIFVKLSREFTHLMRLRCARPIFELIEARGCGVIIANSLRLTVAPSRADDNAELAGGVVVGEHLFLDTYDTIRRIKDLLGPDPPQPPIVASGGIVDVGGVVDVIAAGAGAVQLCSMLDLHGVHVLALLRQQLAEIVTPFKSVIAFRDELNESPIEWENAAAHARTLAARPSDRINAVFEQTSQIDEVLADTIKVECSDVCSPPTAEAAGADPQAHTRFVVTKGNVSGWMLGQAIIERYAFCAIECVNSGEFCRKLKGIDFGWDLALLPRSCFDFLLRQEADTLGGRTPREIGKAFQSVYELVGVSTSGLDAVGNLFHFGGNSSRHALGQLLKHCRPRATEVIGKQVLPLLTFWEEGAAILAKPPLSRLYRMFCKDSLQSVWQTLWSNKEDVLLVGSADFLEQPENKQRALAVLQELAARREGLLEDPSRWARRVRMEGFARDCIRLLEGLP